MDRTQADAFIDLLVGSKSLGVDSNGDEVGAPISPEMRAFIVARLGDKTPLHAHHMRRSPEMASRMAGLLREVADGISP